MSGDLKLEFAIVGQDEASASLRSVITTLKNLEKQAERTGKALRANLSGGLMGGSGASGAAEVRNVEKVAAARAKAATDAVRNAGKVWRLRQNSEKAEGASIAATGKAWADAQRRRMSIMDRSAAVELRRQRETTRAEVRAIRETADARARAERDTYRQIRQRWSVRERAERMERQEAERAGKVSASTAASQAKAEAAATNNRMTGIARTWRMRQASEASEMRHLKAVGRERTAMRRNAARAGREALRHGRHAVRSVNHPAFESIGHATALGMAFGAGAAKTILERSVDIDSAAARYRMFAVPQGVDPTKATAEAVRAAKLDSIKLGMDASTLLDIQAKAVRDGISPAIAKTLPASIAAAAKLMGGDPERLTDTLSEGIQQGLSMGLMKDAGDVRRFLNLEAGLSNFAGNSSEKMEQFVAAGGIGRGKEFGLNLTNTMAYGALLNSSGMRTGQASSRFLGQLSQNVPKMYDRYRRATESRKNTEEDRAVRSAPSALGYGSIREMQSRILAGPEGLIEFSIRLNKLNEKQRKLILEGYGFSEQGGAALAEIGASPEKAKGVLKRAKELAEQKEANDYLSDKFKDWQTSLANMLQQIEAGWRAIESELGDVLKNDIVSPLRDWWSGVSARIIGSGMKDDAHKAIMAFTNGLGFADMKAMLDNMSANVHGFDPAGFMRGLGEGIRTVVDDLRSFGSVLGWMSGSGDGEALGKFTAEMFGLSVALHVAAPVVTIIGGMASAFLALKAACEVGAWVSDLTGITAALKGIVGVELASTAAGLMSLAGALGVIGVAVQGLISAGVLNKIEIPHDLSKESWDRFAWGRKPDGTSARPAWVDRWFGTGASPNGTDGSDLAKGPHGGLLPRRQSFDGAGFNSLRQDISWYPSDSGDVTRNAILGTERGVVAIRESVDRLADKLAAATSSGAASVAGFGDGGGRPNIRFGHSGSALSGAMPNMRYGHSGTTPGSGQAREIGPHVALGKMGAKFAQKAPVLMDGLMKKYGLTREQAAGIVGNLGHESAGFTAYHEGGQAPGKGGVGWAQWTGSRRRAFEKWTAAHGLNPTSDEASWRYLTEGDPETAKAVLAVKRTTNRRDAVRAWEQSFERAGVKAYGSRDQYADKAFAAQPGGATVTAEKPLGTPENPVVVKPDVRSIGKGMSPADIAGQVPTHARPRPGSDNVPAGTTADNSTTNHTWHVYGEPARQAVARHLDSRGSGSTIDLDAFS